MVKRALFDTYCDRCLRFLVKVPKDSITYCPRCQHITKLRAGEKPKGKGVNDGKG